MLYRQSVDTSNPFTKLAPSLRVYIREDPLRATYPLHLQFLSFQAINIAKVIEEDGIARSVPRFTQGDKIPYVLKVVKRLTGVVQPASIAMLNNPYATPQNEVEQLVVSGIQYYSGGSLQHVLDKQRVKEFGWERWAIQIGNTLGVIHRAGTTHMDIKPSNVVLDYDGNVVPIDISGIDGVTHEWRAPETQDEILPIELPFQARRLNDMWAYGKLLAEIASNAGDSPFAGTLKWVSGHFTEYIRNRWTLSEGIFQMEKLSVD
ncbi:uncharacterized protein PGRI_062010 [Penicillium griseofulvum]|uniref:Protein kinase domain-containing protein n=1 Tax=Penicillium patulum TaxID=5078 RepID=A0A135LMQ6_PENPA|nr:uncharacterized protein PGRI_062010 [Penicillium griseofulvum]KXG50234.1 hypothetical protein PGRI_062010 [Penicillium griseofulvum]